MKYLFTLLFAVLLLVSCSAPTASTEVPPASDPVELTAEDMLQPVDSSPVLFQIVKADGTTFDVTLDAVEALPLAQVTAEGKVEEGPYLMDVLALAGITQFAEVTLTGSSNPATLTFEQVDNNTILDFNNHGTMKLATTYIPKSNWTKDVSQITVK